MDRFKIALKFKDESNFPGFLDLSADGLMLHSRSLIFMSFIMAASTMVMFISCMVIAGTSIKGPTWIQNVSENSTLKDLPAMLEVAKEDHHVLFFSVI